MTLPFEIPDRYKRKYQCFVCGCMFEDFDEFKLHILETHEEGREYVLCPLQRCGAPVRDLKTHFKARHPSEKMPKAGQFKALIWTDFKGGKAKRKKKVNFRKGYYHSTKMNKSMKYDSGYECKIFECLDVLEEVEAFDAQPFKVPYVHQGKTHEYTPDIWVKFKDGHIEIWEVKPANQTMMQKNRDKWDSCVKACRARGWKFEVVTEKGIRILEQQVRSQNADNATWLEDSSEE